MRTILLIPRPILLFVSIIAITIIAGLLTLGALDILTTTPEEKHQEKVAEWKERAEVVNTANLINEYVLAQQAFRKRHDRFATIAEIPSTRHVIERARIQKGFQLDLSEGRIAIEYQLEFDHLDDVPDAYGNTSEGVDIMYEMEVQDMSDWIRCQAPRWVPCIYLPDEASVKGSMVTPSLMESPAGAVEPTQDARSAIDADTHSRSKSPKRRIVTRR